MPMPIFPGRLTQVVLPTRWFPYQALFSSSIIIRLGLLSISTTQHLSLSILASVLTTDHFAALHSMSY